MTAFLVLLAVLVAIIAAVVYADARGWSPWPWLYGSDYLAPWSDREPGDLNG